MSAIPERARPHHWGFANAWLRNSFKRKPETMVAAIARAPGPDPVVEAWRNFAKTLDEEERLAPEGLETSSYRIPGDKGDWFVAVVELPRPEGREEAHALALAVRPDDELAPRREDEGPRDSTDRRYFVLEHIPDEGTRLVEWIGDQQTIRDGRPDPNVESLIDALRELLD